MARVKTNEEKKYTTHLFGANNYNIIVRRQSVGSRDGLGREVTVVTAAVVVLREPVTGGGRREI